MHAMWQNTGKAKRGASRRAGGKKGRNITQKLSSYTAAVACVH
jgi:hypothetical protein